MVYSKVQLYKSKKKNHKISIGKQILINIQKIKKTQVKQKIIIVTLPKYL